LIRIVKAFALALLFFSSLPVHAQNADEDGGGFLERLIEDKLSSAGRDVRITGFRGALSSRATLDELVISDEQGDWLMLRNAVLDWNRSALLRGRLEVTELSAEELLLPRLPRTAPSNVPSPEAQPFSLPDLPVSISIGTLNIARADLGKDLFGRAAVVSLEGRAELAGGAVDAELSIVRVDGEEGRLTLAAQYSNSDRVLGLDLSLQEGPDGIVANLIDLPGRPALALDVTGDGPLSDFAADIGLATEGQERLAGQVTLSESGTGPDGVRSFTADIGGDIAPVFTPQFRPFFGPDIRLQLEGRMYGDGRLEIPQLDLTAQAVTLSGNLALDAQKVPQRIRLKGRIAGGNGPVLLPFGQDIRLNEATLDVAFDAAEGEDWRGTVAVTGLDTASADIAGLTLTGTGRIATGADGPSVTADLSFSADGVALADGGAQQALGERVTGAAAIGWSAGQPVVLDGLRIQGESYDLEGSGRVVSVDGGTDLSLKADLSAQDLSVFSGVAGRPISGAADVAVDLTYGLLKNSFDLAVRGRTTDLRVAQPQLDPLLAGQARLILEADRDETGTRLRRLDLEAPNVALTARADLTSTRSVVTADLNVPDASVIDPRATGTVAAKVDARLNDGTWSYEISADGLQADIAATGTVGELDADAPLVTTDASVTAGDLSLFSSFAGRPMGGAVDVTAKGSIRTDLSGFDMTVAGQTRDLETGIAQADALLAGQTELHVSALRGSEGIDVRQLDLSNPQVEVSGTGFYATVSDATTRGQATLRLGDLSLLLSDLQGAATADVRIAGIAGGWNLKLNGSAMDARIDADLDVTGIADTPKLAGRAAIAATDLSRFAAIAKRPLAGGVDLQLDGTAMADASAFDLTVAGTTEDLKVGIEQADGLLTGRTVLDIAARRDGDRYEVSRLSVQGAQISATGNGIYAPGQSRFTGDVGIADIGLAVPGMRGALSARGTVEEIAGGWRADVTAEGLEARLNAKVDVTSLATAPRVEGQADLRAGDLSRFAPLAKRPLGGSVDLSASGFAVADASAFDLEINGRTQDLAVGIAQLDGLMRGATELAVDAARSGEQIDVPRFRLVNPQIRAVGSGSYAPDAGSVTATIDIDDAAEIMPQLSGPVRLDVSGQQAGDGWTVDATGAGLGATLAAQADVTDIASGAPMIDGRASLTASDLARFRALAGRPLDGAVTVEAAGRIKTDLSVYDMTLSVDGRQLRIGQTDADRILGGTTRLDLSVARDGDGTPIVIRQADLATPSLTAQAQGRYGAGQSDLTFTARLADIAPYAPGFSGPVTAQGDVREAGGAGLRLDLRAEGPGGTVANVSGTAQPDFSAVDLGVTGQAPLALANRLIAPKSVVGRADFDLRIAGAPSLGAVSGRVSTAGARAVLPELGIVLNDINATVALSGGSAQISATLAKQEGGQVRVSGPVALSAPYNADLTAQVVDLAISDPQLYETTVSGTVAMRGALAGGATISGQLGLGPTELRIPSTGLGATGPVPDIRHVNEPADVRATRRRAGLIDQNGNAGSGASGSGGGAAYPLDLTILAENRIFVRGRGLDAELGGSLTLTGTTADVVPAGEFDLIRGRLDILGKRLVLDEGRISLQGDFKPFIRLVASTESGDVTILIVIEGPALAPDIGFLSQPELPEDEVLARLLFGRSITDISPLQAAQLASAVATLAGRGGDGIVGRLRQNFGLDDLDVTTDDQGNAALRAGKYLSDNLYTDVTVDAQGEAQINLNLDVSKSVTVKGGASNSGETSLGVFFERDY